MAENEIIDLGHRLVWGRTRRALRDAACSMDDVVAAMTADVEGVCRGLPKALRKGPPLALLLKAAMGSPLHIQALIAQFNEKSIALLVHDARKLARSDDPSDIANVAAKYLVDRLIDQVDNRAGKEARFRSSESRAQLLAAASKAFRSYETQLSSILEASLRGAPMSPVKHRATAPPKMTAPQLMKLSVLPPPTEGHRDVS